MSSKIIIQFWLSPVRRRRRRGEGGTRDKMSALFDDISRIVASPISRRAAFRQVSRAVGGAALGYLGLRRAVWTLAAPAAQVGCPSGQTACSTICCGSEQTCCISKDGAKAACCTKGQTCCGGKCCKGTKCCDGKCCKAGPLTRRALIGGAAAGAVAATVGATAAGSSSSACKSGQTKCGTNCCSSGQSCCNSTICCNSGQNCCTSSGVTKCCNPGTICCPGPTAGKVQCCNASTSASCVGATKCV